MSTSFLGVRNLGVQKFSKLNLKTVKEEVKESSESSSSTGSTTSNSGVNNEPAQSTQQTYFETWLNSEYYSRIVGISGYNNETINDNASFNYSTSLSEEDVNNWDALQKAIKDMGLRETSCRGVYCEVHNPNMPAGDYRYQRHYVWNDSTQKMVELSNVYYLSSDGRQAKGLKGYEEIQAYAQGFRFTETDGVYTKDGKNYKFNVQTSKFEEIVNNKSGLEKLWDKYQTDENDKYVTMDKVFPFIQELYEVLMSEEYNYTLEQFQELLQKAADKCPKRTLYPGLTKLNLKEFVTIVRNIIEGVEEPEEPEKSLADKVLDKYDTEEYDKLVIAKDAVSTILEILNELIPVLQNDYGMSSKDINELLQTVVQNNMIKRIGSDETFVNVRMLVQDLKEAIANFGVSEPEEPKKDPVDEVLDKYNTDEYDKLISGRDAAQTLLKILAELTPVLQDEYGMSADEITELFQTEIQNNLIRKIGSNETFINIRNFVQSLRDVLPNGKLYIIMEYLK